MRSLSLIPDSYSSWQVFMSRSQIYSILVLPDGLYYFFKITLDDTLYTLFLLEL